MLAALLVCVAAVSGCSEREPALGQWGMDIPPIEGGDALDDAAPRLIGSPHSARSVPNSVIIRIHEDKSFLMHSSLRHVGRARTYGRWEREGQEVVLYAALPFGARPPQDARIPFARCRVEGETLVVRWAADGPGPAEFTLSRW